MKRTTRTIAAARLAALSLGVAAIFGAATHPQASGLHHVVAPGDAVKWGAAPPSLPPGAQGAALFGAPAKPGPFVLRLKFPAGFVVAPHRHSQDEFVTVLSGKIAFGAGEKVDRASLKALPPGSFVHLPAGMPHYVVTFEDTVLQVNAMGPFDVIYVDPKDDPRKR